MARISRRTFLMGLAAGTVAAGCSMLDGKQVETTRRTLPFDRLPKAFNGFTICHLSDLHMAEYGKDQRDLVAAIKEAGPDIVVMTGDMLNGWDSDERPFLALCDRLPAIAPTYFVTGNHDVGPCHQGLGDRVAERGVLYLDNRHSVIERGGDRIYLAGAGELGMYGRRGVLRAMEYVPVEAFTALLAHRPIRVARHALIGVDLALSGHTHGGQVRVPLLGPVLAPDQGFFPRYSAGLYRVGATSVYISRGLGESRVPFRFNCAREIAYLTLESPA